MPRTAATPDTGAPRPVAGGARQVDPPWHVLADETGLKPVAPYNGRHLRDP